MTRQSSTLLILQANQAKSTGTKNVAEEVLHEEAVTKDVVGEVDNSTDQHTYHQSETSREKLTILERS